MSDNDHDDPFDLNHSRMPCVWLTKKIADKLGYKDGDTMRSPTFEARVCILNCSPTKDTANPDNGRNI